MSGNSWNAGKIDIKRVERLLISIWLLLNESSIIELTPKSFIDNKNWRSKLRCYRLKQLSDFHFLKNSVIL